jgi:hypothetical protein
VPTETPFPTFTPGPTASPQPTATPVSQEVFDTEFGDFMAQFNDLGIDETTYRSVVQTQLCRERLTDVLAEEEGLNIRAPHASIFMLTFDSEEEANEALAQVEEGDFLTVWNTIRSRPPEAVTDEEDGEAAEPLFTATASELLWRTQETLAGSQGEEVAEAAFSLPLNEPSEVLTVTQPDGTTQQYIIVMVSGREERDLSESELNTRKQEILQSYVDQQLAGELVIRDLWRNRVPTVPVLDSKFLAAPTATPVVPTIPAAIEETPTGDGE